MAEQRSHPAVEESEGVGGEPACWLNLVCDVCGAVNERAAGPCWRCDTPAPAAR